MSRLAAIGLLLTTATQFRLGGLPIGPGEVCLVIWLGLSLLHQTYRSGSLLTPAFSRMLMFWAVFAVAESLGALTGYAIGYPHDPGLFLHDIMAYPLMAAFGCLSVAGPEAETRLHQMAWTLATVGAACLVPQLAAGWDLTDLPFMSPWFGDRFRGWSNNPNQLAFLCAVLVLVTVHLADKASRRAEWILALACSFPPFCVGRLTKTDTFTFALSAAALVFPVVKLRTWMISAQFGHTLRPRIAVIACIGMPLILLSLSPFLLSAVGDPQALAMGMMKNGGKEAKQESKLRFELWGEAINRGLEAHMLGLGPGPHLPIPSSIIAARNSEPGLDTGDHPAVNGMPNFEAHNTILDLFTQGGLIAVLSFLWLVTTAFVSGYKARLAGLAALLIGLVMFALTDLIVREPIFWFGIALCLVAGNGNWRAPANAPPATAPRY
jgi:hypothetical protein